MSYDFEKSFKRSEMIIRIVWFTMAVMVVGTIIGVVVLSNAVSSNPEAVGNFLGRIAKGFIEAAK